MHALCVRKKLSLQLCLDLGTNLFAVPRTREIISSSDSDTFEEHGASTVSPSAMREQGGPQVSCASRLRITRQRAQYRINTSFAIEDVLQY